VQRKRKVKERWAVQGRGLGEPPRLSRRVQRGAPCPGRAGEAGSLLQRVSGTSVQEIEKLIAELQILRDMLQKEAARVQREIVGYAVLIQNVRQSMSTISETLSWKNDRPASRKSESG
jgi:hypothetical protein